MLVHLQVNVLGLCILTREFIKQLRERNVDDGHVIHISRFVLHCSIVIILMFLVRLDTK